MQNTFWKNPYCWHWFFLQEPPVNIWRLLNWKRLAPQAPLFPLSHPPSYRSGDGHGTPLQYSCLENPMDRGAWWAAVLGIAKSRTQLSDFTFTFHLHALEKEMATHCSVLAWRIPGMVEPGGLPSMGSHRVGHDWSDLAAAAATAQSFGWMCWSQSVAVLECSLKEPRHNQWRLFLRSKLEAITHIMPTSSQQLV